MCCHLELDDDPPLFVPGLRDVLHHTLVLLRSLAHVIVNHGDKITTLNSYLLLNFLTFEKLFNYFLKASSCQTLLPYS